MSLTKSKTARLAAGVVGFAMAVSVFVPSLAGAQTSADLQAQINSLLATIASLQSQLAGQGGSTAPAMATGYTFNTNLTMGSTGADVMNLQKVLNMSADTRVAATGVGSSGNESSYFGAMTKAAVIKFQNKYGITPAAGYVGPITRAKLNSMGGSSTGTGTGTGTGGVVVPTAGSLMVSAGAQPANSLAPQSAARVPFTTVTLTAGAADVTVNSITVERVGLMQDAALSGVVLLDSNGTQIGIAKTLNSNHQAMVGEPFVVKAGTSRTVTVAGNMNSSLSSYAGQVGGINVVAVNTSSSVSGALPVMGAQHTVNASLTLGGVTIGTSSYDPGTSQSKEIGTTNYKFSGFRLTANSAEQVRLWSVRFNQTGSASSQDLANVKIYVDGTAYDTVVSADGKYYTANFSGGILIDRGLSKDVYIQGDIVGTGASGRTVKFDIYKNTDVYVSGVTYGYGLTPPAGGNSVVTCSTSQACGNFTTGTPWFQANILTISAGSVTTIGKANSVIAQNIAVNVPNQVLGGFTTDIKGEPITIQSMAFTIATSGTWTSSTGITNITIVDENGAVVAGPIDEATTCTTGCTITFTDSVTFPVGPKTYTIKGKIPTGAPNGATVVVSATPSSGWTNVTGQTTGNTISLSGNGAFSMNTMTVKGSALTVTVGSTPAAQSIVSGGRITFTNFQFDASQSGEDVRFGSLPVAFDQADSGTAGAPNVLSSCQLYDGATALNSGSNVLNPTATATTTSPLAMTITLDSQFTVAKGTVKVLSLQCNVAASAHNASVFQFGLTNGASMTVTGVTSGSDVSETLTTANGPLMTVASGSFTASVDSSSPSFVLAAGGTSGVNMGVVKFRATNEAVNVSKIGLVLTSGAAADLGTVYLYQGATLLGTATFTGSNTVATSTLNSALSLTKDTDVLITIKADLASIGTSQPGTQGKLVKIDVTNAEGNGGSSGSTLYAAGLTAGTNGVRTFKSMPTIAQDSMSSTGVADGKLMRFKVTANSAGPVGLYALDFTLATSSFATGGGVSAVKVMVYSDSSYSSLVSGTYGDATGQFGQTNGTFNGTSATGLLSAPTLTFRAVTNPLQIPAGTTYYFQVESTVSSTQTGTSVTTTLNGDAAYIDASHLGSDYVSTTTGAIADTNNDFIWSGNATTTAVFNANDWANGYGVLGLPSGGFSQTRSN